MANNPFWGTGVFLLGGVFASLYLLPFRWVKGWRYETGWLLSVLIGWLAYPFVVTTITVGNPWAIVGCDGWWTIARTVFFGVLWGVGALCWALMVRYLGVGLGLAIGAGLCAATGTLLPPVVSGNAASLVATRGACVVLFGVALSLLGIAFVGAAGRVKEGEMSEEAKKRAVADYDFKKGLITAVIAGIASAGINFGLQGAPAWEAAALARGVNPLWAGMPVLMVVLWGGVVTQVGWVLFRLHQASSADKTDVRGLRAISNVLLCLVVGVMGVSQFFTQKIGEPLMGDMRYISFAVLMSSAIFFSTLVGTMLGEWRGTSWKARGLLAVGLAILLFSFALISVGNLW